MKVQISKMVLILILTVCLAAKTSPSQQKPAARHDYRVQNVTALDALIRLGETYNQPMGIVCGDNKIPKMLVSVEASQSTPQEAMDLLMRQLPEYEWKESGGVIFVLPRAMPPLTNKMLTTTITRFTAKDSSADHFSMLLWWELQRKLDPKSGAAGYMGVSHDITHPIDSIDLKGASVQQVLSEIVRKRRSAAWVIPPSIRSVKNTPRDRLWDIIIYAAPPLPLAQLCCLNMDDFK